MVAALLDAGGFDPTVVNGGIINAYGTNARLGAGEWMVVEADECDGTFLRLPADYRHGDQCRPRASRSSTDLRAMRDAFQRFVENVPFYGFAVMCIDHPVVQALVGRIDDRRIITYGDNPQADVRLVDVRFMPAGTSLFDCVFTRPPGGTGHAIRKHRAADAGRAQRRSTPWRRSWWRASSASTTT